MVVRPATTEHCELLFYGIKFHVISTVWWVFSTIQALYRIVMSIVSCFTGVSVFYDFLDNQQKDEAGLFRTHLALSFIATGIFYLVASLVFGCIGTVVVRGMQYSNAFKCSAKHGKRESKTAANDLA
jgi:H+/Cl- antiporter ClcA